MIYSFFFCRNLGYVSWIWILLLEPLSHMKYKDNNISFYSS